MSQSLHLVSFAFLTDNKNAQLNVLLQYAEIYRKTKTH